MYLGTQVGARDDVDLRQWAQLGVVNVCNDPREGNAHTWSRDDLAQLARTRQLFRYRVGHDPVAAVFHSDRKQPKRRA